MVKNNSISTIVRVMELYFIFLCFMYYFQVQLLRNDFVPIIFLFLFTYTIFAVSKSQKSKLTSSVLNTFIKFFYYYIIFITLWIVYEFLVNPTDKQWLRMFIYYACPICLVFLMVRCEAKIQINDIRNLLKVILVLAIITGIEIGYEWLHVNIFLLGTTDFMDKSYHYVNTLGHGDISGQIAKHEGRFLRPPGILSHLHITGTFLGIGILTAIHLFYTEMLNVFLYIAWLLFMVLVLIGSRTALVAAIFSVGLYIYYNKSIIKSSYCINRIRFNYFLRILGIFIFSLILVLWYAGEILYKIYIQYFQSGFFQLRFNKELSYFDVFWTNVVHLSNQMLENPILILFGNGFSSFKEGIGASGDLLLTTLVARNGIIGIFIIFSILLLFIITMRKTIRRVILPPEVKDIANYGLALVIFLVITILHTPVLTKKEIYSYLFLAYGFGLWAYIQSLKRVIT